MNYKDAMEQLGVQYALETNKFKSFPLEFTNFKIIILDILQTDAGAETSNQSGLTDLIRQFKEKASIQKNPNRMSLMLNEFTVQRNEPSKKKFIDSLLNEHINYLLFERITSMLRVVKTSEELSVLQKAIDVSCQGHNESMRAMRPDMSERELQAIHEFIHKKGGAEAEGYPPIVASGNNGCVLHYESNNAEHLGNNLVVMDVGAEYHGYSADVTRTAPANGKFSPEQLTIYNIVLSAHDSAIMAIKAGIPYYELEKIGQRVIADGLIKLGLIKKKSEVTIYYPHGISHPIGLDVHDKYIMGQDLQKNMVITIEPGIYIAEGSNCDKKWWGIGVRIEDDVLVLDDRGDVLSKASPVRPQDIEKLMKEKSIFKPR
jgi:Xaa-Pro aminopeptidase